MKKKILFIVSIFFIIGCIDKKNKIDDFQVSNVPKIKEPTKKMNGFLKNINKSNTFDVYDDKPEIILSYPNKREIDEINNVLSYSGLPMNFDVYCANIQNAIATIIDNKRYIIYDPELFFNLDKRSNSYWSSMSIVAHEIGHHLSGHTMNNNIDNHTMELEADKFSGFILFKMGATLEQATYTITLLGSETDSDSHPSKYKRIQSITKGWYEASIQVSKSAIPPVNEFNDKIVGIEYYIEDFYSKEEIMEYKYDINELGPFVGYIISNKYEESKPFSILVEITELPKNIKNLPSMFGKNKRVEIYLLKPENAPNATLGYYEYVIKPGNKLLFKIHLEGNGGYPNLHYIKILDRK